MAEATTSRRHPGVSVGRRWLLAIAVVALFGSFVAAAVAFVWPSPAARGEYAIGPVDGFALGAVTTYQLRDGELLQLQPGAEYGRRPPGYPIEGSNLVHVVRLPDGEFRVFSGAGPFRESTFVWYQLDRLQSDRGEWVGLFAEPRRGTRWAIDGTRVFGPAPRGLDHYAFHVRADDVLVVDLRDLTKGRGGDDRPPSYDVRSNDWPTSGWPSR